MSHQLVAISVGSWEPLIDELKGAETISYWHLHHHEWYLILTLLSFLSPSSPLMVLGQLAGPAVGEERNAERQERPQPADGSADRG